MATTKKPKTTTELVVDVKPKRDPFYEAPDSIDEFCGYVAKGGHMAKFCEERGLKYTTMQEWIWKKGKTQITKYNTPQKVQMKNPFFFDPA